MQVGTRRTQRSATIATVARVGLTVGWVGLIAACGGASESRPDHTAPSPKPTAESEKPGQETAAPKPSGESKEKRCEQVMSKLAAAGDAAPRDIVRGQRFCTKYVNDDEILCVLAAADGPAMGQCFAQTYKEGVQIICKATEAATGDSNTLEAHRLMVDHIASRLRNSEAISLFAALSPSPASADILAEEATKAGVSPCPMVEALRRLGE